MSHSREWSLLSSAFASLLLHSSTRICSSECIAATASKQHTRRQRRRVRSSLDEVSFQQHHAVLLVPFPAGYRIAAITRSSPFSPPQPATTLGQDTIHSCHLDRLQSCLAPRSRVGTEEERELATREGCQEALEAAVGGQWQHLVGVLPVQQASAPLHQDRARRAYPRPRRRGTNERSSRI